MRQSMTPMAVATSGNLRGVLLDRLRRAVVDISRDLSSCMSIMSKCLA